MSSVIQSSLLDKVSVHETDQGGRPAEADRAELQEIANERP